MAVAKHNRAHKAPVRPFSPLNDRLLDHVVLARHKILTAMDHHPTAVELTDALDLLDATVELLDKEAP